MNKHTSNDDNNIMDWSYEHTLLYHYIEYKSIEQIWTKQLDLNQLQQQLFQQQRVWLQGNNFSRNVI